MSSTYLFVSVYDDRVVFKRFNHYMEKHRFPREGKLQSPRKSLVISQLIQFFAKEYPEPESELNFTNEFQLLISVMLSAQTTDKKVNEITPELFAKFPGFHEIMLARRGDIEQVVRPINYYRTKAKHIIEASRIVMEQFGGSLPSTLDELLSLPGVGRKTANVVLAERRIVPTIAVDTHVYRVSHRLGLSSGKRPRDVEEDLMKLFDPKEWRNLHHYLILHGRRVCNARKPNCAQCIVARLCPSRRKD